MSPFLKQCLVTLSVLMNMMALSAALGYPAVLFPQLRGSASMQLSAAQESWLASILAAMMLLGNLVMVPAMRRGRKMAHYLVSLLHVAAWITISLAQSYEVIMVGRFIQGTAFGLFYPISGVIIGEYTSPMYRGAFLASLSLGQGIGITLVHVIGSLISWKYTALLFSFFPITSLVITIFLPESPSWLAVEARYEDCRKAFRWLRGCNEEEELKKLIEARQHVSRTNPGGSLEILRAFSKREVYISLVLGALMYTISMACGAVILASYMNELLQVIISQDCNVPAWMAFCDGVRLASNSLGLYIVGRMRRRTMLFSSGALCVIAFLVQAGYIHAKTNGLVQEALWLPVILLTFYVTTIGLGAILVPIVIIGEIYPLQYRSLCCCITNLYLVVCLFTILKTFPGMKTSIGLEGAYLVYAGVVTLALVVSWFLLPETKGRTLQEIEEHFRGKPIVNSEDNGKELKPLKDFELKDFA